MKIVKSTNLDFIRKWENLYNSEISNDFWYVTFIDGKLVTKIDEELQMIYTDCSDISFKDIEKYTVYTNKCFDEELKYDVESFFKEIKNAKNFANKLYFGSGGVFSRSCDDNFLNKEYLEKWSDLRNLFDDFERGIKLVTMITVEKCFNVMWKYNV